MSQTSCLAPPSGQNRSDSSDRSGPSNGRARRYFRADLHVHSRYSGPGHLHGLGLRAGVGEPETLYRVARSRGMDLVTFTDIDTIDGCLEFLNRHPDTGDFVISEEILACDPRTGRRVHVLLYDISEAQHREARRLKRDVRDLMAYARREGIVASLSPSSHGMPADAWAGPDAEQIIALFERFEVKNGTLGRSQNALAARFVQQSGASRRLGVTAGSNAHGPARIGRTMTVSPARSPREFLGDLRGNRTWAFGEDGSAWDASADLARLIAQQCRTLLNPGGLRGTGRSWAGSLLTIPLHLVGAPYVRHGVRRVRAGVRARSTRRRLDRLVVERFQARSRTLVPAESAAGSTTQRLNNDNVRPDRRHGGTVSD